MNDIDSVLRREEETVPSSGFTESVMEAVRREALAPAPIPFPWARALPGFLAGFCALALVLAEAMRVAAAPPFAVRTAPLSAPDFSALLTTRTVAESGWTLAVLLLTAVTCRLSMRLASGSG